MSRYPPTSSATLRDFHLRFEGNAPQEHVDCALRSIVHNLPGKYRHLVYNANLLSLREGLLMAKRRFLRFSVSIDYKVVSSFSKSLANDITGSRFQIYTQTGLFSIQQASSKLLATTLHSQNNSTSKSNSNPYAFLAGLNTSEESLGIIFHGVTQTQTLETAFQRMNIGRILDTDEYPDSLTSECKSAIVAAVFGELSDAYKAIHSYLICNEKYASNPLKQKEYEIYRANAVFISDILNAFLKCLLEISKEHANAQLSDIDSCDAVSQLARSIFMGLSTAEPLMIDLVKSGRAHVVRDALTLLMDRKHYLSRSAKRRILEILLMSARPYDAIYSKNISFQGAIERAICQTRSAQAELSEILKPIISSVRQDIDIDKSGESSAYITTLKRLINDKTTARNTTKVKVLSQLLDTKHLVRFLIENQDL